MSAIIVATCLQFASVGIADHAVSKEGGVLALAFNGKSQGSSGNCGARGESKPLCPQGPDITLVEGDEMSFEKPDITSRLLPDE